MYRNLLLVCSQIEVGIAALFIGQLTPSLAFVTSLTRQLHIPLFLSSPDPQTKVEYYIINVFPHYTATTQALSDLIKFQQWEELAVVTERAESKEIVRLSSLIADRSFRFTLSSRFVEITDE